MKLDVLGVEDWPLVVEPAGRVVRHCPTTETSYIASGAGEINVRGEEPVPFSAGDLVTVMPDTECAWDITEEIERHYYKG